MKEWKSIIRAFRIFRTFLRGSVLFIISLIIVYCSIYFFITLRGGKFVEDKLGKLLDKNVTVGIFHVTPFLNLEITNLNIENSTKINKAFVSPSRVGLLTGKIAFNKIILMNPEFTLEKMKVEKEEKPKEEIPVSFPPPEAKITPPATTLSQPQEPPVVRLGINRPIADFVIKHFEIKDGVMHFIDHTAGENGIKITADSIHLMISNLYKPARPHTVTDVELEARMPWSENGEKESGKIEFAGWINLYRKDMEASLKIKDIDGVYLYPYYSQYVDLEKARIEKAKLNFTSDLHGVRNNLTAECHLELTDIVFKPRTAEEQQDKAEKLAYTIIDVFKSLNQGKVVLDFTIRTKMDRPEFGFDIVKNAFEDRIEQATRERQPEVTNIMMLPTKLIEGAVKGATDLTTSVVTGTIKAGAEIGKSVGEVFKKNKKE